MSVLVLFFCFVVGLDFGGSSWSYYVGSWWSSWGCVLILWVFFGFFFSLFIDLLFVFFVFGWGCCFYFCFYGNVWFLFVGFVFLLLCSLFGFKFILVGLFLVGIVGGFYSFVVVGDLDGEC